MADVAGKGHWVPVWRTDCMAQDWSPLHAVHLTKDDMTKDSMFKIHFWIKQRGQEMSIKIYYKESKISGTRTVFLFCLYTKHLSALLKRTHCTIQIISRWGTWTIKGSFKQLNRSPLFVLFLPLHLQVFSNTWSSRCARLMWILSKYKLNRKDYMFSMLLELLILSKRMSMIGMLLRR